MYSRISHFQVTIHLRLIYVNLHIRRKICRHETYPDGYEGRFAVHPREAQEMGKKHSAELNVKVVDYPNMVYVAGQSSGAKTSKLMVSR